MEPLTLNFDGLNVTGEGRDLVGTFTFEGVYFDGAVSLVKQYVGMHSVRYEGKSDGEGVIAGTWNIGEWIHGSFVLMPARETAASLPIAEAVFSQ